MPSDPTTAAELHALVSQWPVEAQPKAVEFEDDAGELICCNKYGACFYLPHAIDLHIASGLRWYMARQESQIKTANLMIRGDGLHSIRRSDDSDSDGSGPSHLHALHAAIMATAKGGA